MTYRVAVIEDDSNLRDNYRDAFKKQGYIVEGFSNRTDAQQIMASRLPDLAVIDIGLGDEADGGYALCQWLRQRSETMPIIFLSALDDDVDIVSGLRMGADDYLTKDISLTHLMARVAALFRRIEVMKNSAQEPEQIVEAGSLVIDGQRLNCRWKDVIVELTLTEFWMVYALVRRTGHVKSREQLMSDAHLVVDDGTITSHIKRIRRKFLAADAEFNCIDTVYGLGYRWNANV